MTNLLFKEISVVAIGGALGSVARLLLARGIQIFLPFEALPWGIITTNIVGCFCIGALYALFQAHYILNPLWRVGLVIGILGGFTTFSSFSLDTMVFLYKGNFHAAMMNVFISITCCLLATAVGMYVVNLFVAVKG